MQVISKVTSKGQITIPKEIRDILGLNKGSVLIFEVRDNAVNMRVSKTIRDYRETLPEVGIPFEDIRKEVKRKLARGIINEGSN